MDALPGMARALVWKACWQCDVAEPLYCRMSRVYTALHESEVCCPWCRQACQGSEDTGAQSLA